MIMPAAVEPKSSFLESITPWATNRSATLQNVPDSPDKADGLKQTAGQDHVTSYKKRLSALRYPPDCPPLQTRWFYAVDNPKSKPSFEGLSKKEPSKPLPPAKKFIAFFPKDSQEIEKAFQQLLSQETKETPETVSKDESSQGTIKVPVNEDYLYDVDVDKRELAPAYWLGPVYEVRRGTWFFHDGSGLKPCEENLATQLEEGFLKLKPWQAQYGQNQNTSNAGGSTAVADATVPSQPPTNGATSAPEVGGKKSEESKPMQEHADSQARPATPAQSLPVYRLFGAHMNITVTYQDSTVAWLNYDDFMSRVSSTVYQRFGGVGGTKVVRGYSEPGTQKETTDPKVVPSRKSSSSSVTSSADAIGDGKFKDKESDRVKSGEDHESDKSKGHSNLSDINSDLKSKGLSTGHRITLQRQISSLNGEAGNTAELEEEARKQEEQEMEDSRETEGEDRDREIDHLILVTHGIGQRIGLRLDSINFISDVTTLRKTMKSVYAASPDLQALNSQYPDAKNNCRVQVLPVSVSHC